MTRLIKVDDYMERGMAVLKDCDVQFANHACQPSSFTWTGPFVPAFRVDVVEESVPVGVAYYEVN